MPDSPALNIALIVVCVILSGFFSSSEAAFLSLQRARLAHLVETRKSGALRVSQMMEEPERLLSTILLGNNLVNVAFASLVTVTTVALLGEGREGTGVLVATGVATAALLIVGEIVPKAFAVVYAERLALLYARPLQIIETLLMPFVAVLHRIGRVARVGTDPTELQRSITESELRTLIGIGEAEGELESGEAVMLENVFRFGDRQVREVMTPRTEIVFLGSRATMRDFLTVYAGNPHTRFPVYKDSPDDVVGIVSAKDVLRGIATEAIPSDGSIAEAVRDTYFVPETKRIDGLFDELRESGNQMAIVIDEYGGVAGLVTLKRLLEQIVGPVGEEGQGPEEEYEAIDENTFNVEGSLSITQLKEDLQVELPEGDFETVAGLVLELLGHIPRPGEHVEYNGLTLEVMSVDNLKIDTVKVTRSPAPQEEAEQGG